MTAGEGNICGLHTDGRLECWGRGYYTKLSQASFFSAGERYVCGGSSDGSQFWGLIRQLTDCPWRHDCMEVPDC